MSARFPLAPAGGGSLATPRKISSLRTVGRCGTVKKVVASRRRAGSQCIAAGSSCNESVLGKGGGLFLRKARNKFYSIERLTDGEPYFVLRAQDRLAPELVEAWAIEAELNGCAPAKVKDAREIAKAMRNWSGKKKMPD
jgi:hypothetical protein